MKTLLIVILLSISFPLFALDKCMTGSWYDPDNSGSGVDIQVLGDFTTVKYYAYGSSRQAWYVMNGEGGNLNMIATVYDAGVVTEHDVGSAHIEQIDNNTITFDFDINIDVDNGFNWCLSDFCQGNLTYTRITTPIPCD